MLQTIQKAGEVLALFDPTHTEWGVREVAERLELAKSSAHDLLSSLAQTGFLNKTDEGRYRLGWRLVSMSDTLLNTTELCQETRPVMEEMSAFYHETIHLGVMDDTKVVCLDKVEGKQAVRVDLAPMGSRLYPHCCANGKMMLAHLPQEEVDRIIQKDGLPRLTPHTITDADELYQVLEKSRKLGYAYDLEESLPDLCCIAAPIYNYRGKVIASVSMSVPAYRFLRSQEEYRKAVIHAGKTISKRLGFCAPKELAPNKARL